MGRSHTTIVTAPRRKRQSFRGLTPRLQPESQNVQGGVVVPVLLHLAARTTIRPVGQGHLLPMSAEGTGLGRIGRIHLPKLPTGALSLVGEKEEELRPRRIADASVQASVGVHLVDRDVFHEDPSVPVHDLPGFPVGEVGTLVRNTLMNFCHDLFGFFSFRRSFLLKLQFSLCLGDPFGRALQERRVLDDRSVGKSRKRSDPDIDPHRERVGGESLFLHVLAGKSRPPFSGGRPENAAGLDLALDRTVKDNRNGSDLRQPEAVARQVASAVPLRKSDRGILSLPLETGIPRIFSVLRSPEEGLERQIDADGHVLERLGIDRIQRRPALFQRRKRSGLVVQGQSGSVPFPGVSSMLQKMVVEPAAFLQLPGQKRFLFPGRIQPIPECASRIVQTNEIRTISQESEGHAYILVRKGEVLRRFFDKPFHWELNYGSQA